jgi:hypothetical protein
VAILWLAALASACASTADQSVQASLAAQAPPPSASAGAAEPIRYVCIVGHASFTIADIEDAPAADVRADPAWDLLQTLLDEQADVEESDLPMDGWRRVVDTPEEVVFLAGTPLRVGSLAVVHVVPGGGYMAQDGWGVDSFGGCIPRPEVSDGVRVADWWVDPDAKPIGPEADRIPAVVHERACSGGRTAEGRIPPPTIVYGPTKVVITITVRVIGGPCISNPVTPFTIELAEPLGDRSLADGGRFPPGDPFEIPED